jgi:hypothetical protein
VIGGRRGHYELGANFVFVGLRKKKGNAGEVVTAEDVNLSIGIIINS